MENGYISFKLLCPALSVYIWFENKNKSNCSYKFTTQFFSFNKESFDIIQNNNKKDMTVVDNPLNGNNYLSENRLEHTRNSLLLQMTILF